MAGPVDVAILTVIPAELRAARAALAIPDDAWEKDSHGTIYYLATVRSALQPRDYRVVLTCIGMAGNPSAAAATSDAIATYTPRAAILVGIAAGMRGKVKIGEVVLGERVVAYEPAALTQLADGTSQEQPRPEIERLSQTMQQDVVNYDLNPSRLNQMFAAIGGTFPTAPVGQEREYQQHVAASITATISTIASGEKLLRDPSKLLSIRNIHGKTEVGEMEATGFTEACRRRGVAWLVIRGISDFGDEFKNDAFHTFASQAAAVVLVDFLKYGLRLPQTAPSEVGTPSSPAVNPAHQAVGKHTPTLLDRISDWLDEDELRKLCHDHFPQVYRQFSAGMSFDAMALRLVDFARRKRQVARLLDLLETTNPGMIGADRAALLAQLGGTQPDAAQEHSQGPAGSSRFSGPVIIGDGNVVNSTGSSSFVVKDSASAPTKFNANRVAYLSALDRMNQLIAAFAPESASEFLVYESRLRENLDRETRYGSTETIRSERFEIIDQLNGLAQQQLGTTFNDLSQGA